MQQSSQTPRYVAVAILARRDHSVHEMRQKLKNKGIGEDEITGVISWLQSKNFLNDLVFAQRKAESIFRTKLVGPSYIKIKLKAAGIADNIIEEALAALADEQQWQSRAAKAITQWKKAHPKHAEDKIRHMRFLQSRGFGLHHP